MAHALRQFTPFSSEQLVVCRVLSVPDLFLILPFAYGLLLQELIPPASVTALLCHPDLAGGISKQRNTP